MSARPAPPPLPRRLRLVPAALAAAALLALSGPARTVRTDPPDQEESYFSGREQVTAVDVAVEVVRTVGPSAGAPLPGGMAPGDFTVEVGGEPRTVVAVEAPRKPPGKKRRGAGRSDGGGAAAGRQDEAAAAGQPEPWSIVVYFDLGLATPEAVRWAVEDLSGRAAELADRGSVEVVVADATPEGTPRRLLAPSREPEKIEQALARVAQFYRGREILVRLRRELVAELTAPTSDTPPAEVARIALGEEERIVRDRLDDLAGWLVDNGSDAYPGPRRALLLVSGGFDLDPAAFYRGRLAEAGAGAEGADAGPALSDPGLAGATAAFERTLAAYGWIALCLGPPEVDEPHWGWRRKLQVRIDRNWDPEKAAAYVQLGLALREQGKLDDAIDAFERALYHFYDYPKNRREQARTSVYLGETLARAGRADEAEEAFRQALALDPDLAGRFPALGARLADPLAPLAALAEATAGRLARDGEALADALTSLDRRVVLTYQIPGPPDGGVRPLTTAIGRTGYRAHAPAWGRSATPEEVAALRLRRLLAGESTGGDLPFRAVFAPVGDAGPGGVPGLLDLRVDLAALAPEAADRGVRFRVGAATGGPGTPPGEPRFDLALPESASGRPSWERTLDVTLAPGQTSIAVVVDELVSGRWGGVLVEVSSSVWPGGPPARGRSRER